MTDYQIDFAEFNTFHSSGKNDRTKKVGAVVSYFALFTHVCFLALFFYLKVYPLCFFNVFSVTLFAINCIFLKKYTSPLQVYLISSIEVIVHQILVVWFLGADAGFQYFIIISAIIPFLILEDYPKLSVVCSGICISAFLYAQFVLVNHIPEFTIDPQIMFILRISAITLTLLTIAAVSKVFTITVQNLEKQVFKQYKATDNLLHNIFPESIAEKLKAKQTVIADSYDSVAILFLDIVNFTKFSSSLSAERLVMLLNKLFSEFDMLTTEYHVEKIKTIGDSYMAAAGLPEPNKESYHHIADFALRLLTVVNAFNVENETDLQVRIGIHAGPVVAGVIGAKKFVYDLWGSTVNYASRMESTSEPGKIQVSNVMYTLLKDDYLFEKRDPIEVKGIGLCTSHFLRCAVPTNLKN